jgi:hypothetical protein
MSWTKHKWGLGVIALIVFMSVPATAQAYVGPGGVITALGAVFGLFAAFVASIVGFLWFPLKRLLIWVRKRRGRTEEMGPAASSDAGTA